VRWEHLWEDEGVEPGRDPQVHANIVGAFRRAVWSREYDPNQPQPGDRWPPDLDLFRRRDKKGNWDFRAAHIRERVRLMCDGWELLR